MTETMNRIKTLKKREQKYKSPSESIRYRIYS